MNTFYTFAPVKLPLFSMKRKILIRDLTLRDGQQSLFATHMNQSQVDRVLPYFKDAGFYAMEVWGGAVPDSVMRYLNENPWDRLSKIKAGIGNSSKLTALSRGRNLFGYNPYPDEVIEGFYFHAIESGIDIMRIFDALNDVDNIRSSVHFVKKFGGLADCTVCYTVDPRFTPRQKAQYLVHFRTWPKRIFSADYFVQKAKEMEQFGADMISLKDMAGLITPCRTALIIGKMKEELCIPIDFHTHCTPGYGLASILAAMIYGADIIDTSIMNFAGGPAAPAFEIIQLFADKLQIDTGVNLDAVVRINRELADIRRELAEYDTYKIFPMEFDITRDNLPAEIDKLFDLAIEYAKATKDIRLLEVCHKIEEYFYFPAPDELVRKAEIPGGMYTNMLAQLKQLNLDHLLPKVLELVPYVRVKSGCPPLVTPTGQIVGVQAVNCVLDENKGEPHFTTLSNQYVNLVKGVYGKTPIQVETEFREQITGSPEEVAYDTKNYQKQENPELEEFGGLKLAENEKDQLLLELFPSVARSFLNTKTEEKYLTTIWAIEEEKRCKIEAERQKFYDLSAEEKHTRLMKGLYSWYEVSEPEENLGRS